MRLFLTLLLLAALPGAGGAAPATPPKGQPACQACGLPIEGEYISTALGDFHPLHFLCAGCETPIEGLKYAVKDGAPWCQECYQDRFAPHCPICDAPLQGKVLQDAWGNRFCSRHAEEYPPCDSCSRRVCLNLTGGGVRMEDGRALCNLCRATEVDEAGGRALLALVAAFLREQGVGGADGSLPLSLVSLADLSRGRSKTSNPVRGRTNIVQVAEGGRSRTLVEDIWILKGLPAEEFAAVAAHELLHAHLAAGGFPPLSEETEEGLCELGSFLWLRSRTDPLAAVLARRLEENRTGPYGKGFHLAREAWRGQGLPALLETVRKTGELP